MIFEMPTFALAAPEIFVLIMACAILMLGLFIHPSRHGVLYYVAQASIIGAAALTFLLAPMGLESTFNGLFLLDPIATILKLFIYITTFLAFIYGRDYLVSRHIPQHEYYVLGLFSLLGMLVMVSAGSLITLFIGIELLSLPLYAMVAMRRDHLPSVEAAIKYFVMGAIASSMLLYGMSMLYGATGSLNLFDIASTVGVAHLEENPVLIFGMVLVLAGLAFKLGAAPFHMWVPDVYQGAPTAVTTLLSAAPKLAAFGVIVRVLFNALPALSSEWQQMITLIAILSMALGNFIAIAQVNIKRMLAFSAIAHAGYMLLGVIAAESFGFASAMFYMMAYAIMSVAGFGLLALLSRAGVEIETLEDLKGLNTRNPWMAFMMLIVMFSMAGIPPTIGFFAKMGVLEALIRVNEVGLAAVALLFAIIGAYYYIRVVKVMYFEDPVDATPLPKPAGDAMLAISLNSILIVGLGLFPSGLISLSRMAFGA